MNNKIIAVNNDNCFLLAMAVIYLVYNLVKAKISLVIFFFNTSFLEDMALLKQVFR